MASLTLVVQDREVRTFVLSAAVTTIGRAQDNDIVINNLALSRRHAEVHRRGEGFEVVDRGSQNGVFVNDERIEGPRLLEDADVITLGTYTFVFSSDHAASASPSSEPRSGRRRRRAERGPVAPEEPTPPPGRIEPATPLPSLEPSPVPMVVLTYNDIELQRYALEDEECLIGRAKECDVQIAERRLSRRHCLLFRDEDGRWLVKDLGSQNGTYVNRRRVRDPQLLRHGDILNFAEYAVVFSSDGKSVDAAEGAPPAPLPRASSDIEREQTELPEAYRQPLPEGSSSSSVGLGAPPEPVVSEPPRASGRSGRSATGRSSLTREPELPRSAADASAERGGRRPRTRPEPEPPPARRRPRPAPSRPDERPRNENGGAVEVRGLGPDPRPAPVDVPDPIGDGPRPDPELDDWYAARESDAYEDEPSVLLERSKSSMSQLLSTMMVDKRELDRHLEVARRRRRFAVEVRWGEEVLFEGPLEREVTVLGADRESDLPLRGRYVSGRHSLLVKVRESLLLVRLGSSSAARVNGLPRLQAFLKAGDVIQIDETHITVSEA